MADTSRHTYQIFMKRSKRLASLADSLSLPATVWMWVNVETSRYIFRIDHLRLCPPRCASSALGRCWATSTSLDLSGIDWLVAGGRSGPSARPMHESWVRDLRNQCAAAGVPSSAVGRPYSQSQRPLTRRHPPRRHSRCASEGVGRSCGRQRRQPVPHTADALARSNAIPTFGGAYSQRESGYSCKLSQSCAPVPRASPIHRARSDVIGRSPPKISATVCAGRPSIRRELDATPTAGLEFAAQHAEHHTQFLLGALVRRLGHRSSPCRLLHKLRIEPDDDTGHLLTLRSACSSGPREGNRQLAIPPLGDLWTPVQIDPPGDHNDGRNCGTGLFQCVCGRLRPCAGREHVV